MKRISILGCGWLGLPLAEKLLTKGYIVKGSTTREEKLSLLEAKGIRASKIQLQPKMIGQHISQFFESDVLILNIPPGRKNPNVLDFHPQQIEAVIQQVKQSPIQQVILISSSSVYPLLNRIVKEEDIILGQASKASGQALRIVENKLQKETSFQTSILRMSGLMGGKRHPGRFFAGRKELPNGAAAVNFVHRIDAIGSIIGLIEQQHWGEVYNVCATIHPTKAVFYKKAAQSIALEPPTFKAEKAEGFNIISNEKIKQELNYQFVYDNPMDWF